MRIEKVECVHGHEYTPENTLLTKEGYKKCRTCERARQRVRNYQSLAPERAQARAATIKRIPVLLPLTPRHDDTDWRDQAKCSTIGGDLWFPDKSERHVVDRAKKICATCPVAAMCLEAGIDEQYGVWGGTSPEERKKLRRRRSA